MIYNKSELDGFMPSFWRKKKQAKSLEKKFNSFIYFHRAIIDFIDVMFLFYYSLFVVVFVDDDDAFGLFILVSRQCFFFSFRCSFVYTMFCVSVCVCVFCSMFIHVQSNQWIFFVICLPSFNH